MQRKRSWDLNGSRESSENDANKKGQRSELETGQRISRYKLDNVTE